MEKQPEKPETRPVLPQGITAAEATFLLEVVARLKEKRFGRLEVMVSDGRVVDVELIDVREAAGEP